MPRQPKTKVKRIKGIRFWDGTFRLDGVRERIILRSGRALDTKPKRLANENRYEGFYWNLSKVKWIRKK